MQDEFILGIQGWKTRSHDASACLLKCTNGKVEIVAAAEEERFIGIKHAYDTFPVHAVTFCLDFAGIAPQDLSAVAMPFDYPLIYATRSINLKIDPKDLQESVFPAYRINSQLKFVFVNHHLAHALSAFSPAMVDAASIIVVDGQGENESTTLWRATDRGKNIEKLASSGIGHSLGYFYEALTEFIGFEPNEAGKTMGLAPYGKPHPFYETLRDLVYVHQGVVRVKGLELQVDTSGKTFDEQHLVRPYWMQKFEDITGLNPNDSSRKYSFRKFPRDYLNLAAAGQQLLEKIVVELAMQVHQRTGIVNLGIAGGVGLNCVANGKIAELGIFRKIYVQPASNDAGTSLGAALEVARQKGYDISHTAMTPYLGPSYSDSQIENILKSKHLPCRIEENAARLIAELIEQGKVVGLFQDRAEFGPRALGNRSFVADPRSASMQDLVNGYIKDREDGRPLAPSVMSEQSAYFFGNELDAPHMTVAYKMKTKLDAVTHVDGSTRPQIVTPKANPVFHEQLREINNRLGVGAVLNTSLNRHGPIIHTPYQALQLLEKTEAAALIFNNKYVVMKNA
ncbi:hypothetical protein J4234_02510 [Candidatus Woesearchaeota archaeon]|nr:hypothetical protein [Candidatus Woesearchaeota archaeon]